MRRQDLERLASNITQVNALGVQLRQWRERYRQSTRDQLDDQPATLDARSSHAFNFIEAASGADPAFSFLRRSDAGTARAASGSNVEPIGAVQPAAIDSTQSPRRRSFVFVVSTILVAAALVAFGLSALYVSRHEPRADFTRGPLPSSTRRPHAEVAELPDQHLTPGKILAVRTSTICRPGYASRVRPRGALWRRLKDEAYTRYGLARGHRRVRDLGGHLRPAYEVDHLIPLELGGHPTSLLNLWPEPIASARQKDLVENQLHQLVCSGQMPLGRAQRAIARDWRTAAL